MTRQQFQGGWYPDATPDGGYCVALRGQQIIVTHEGAFDTTPRDLLFTRCAPGGPFRVAGQEGDRPGHQGDGNYEYPDGVRVGNSISVSPVIYDLAGTLQQARASHQGYRYVEHATGRILTGDETYGPFHGLFEYSEAGDGVYVGQAAYDGGGVQVWDGATLRQLETGDCRNVRVQWDGANVAIAFATPRTAVIYQTTRDELRALPAVETPEPVPEPTPEPPEPTPEPEPPDPVPVPPDPPHPPPGPFRAASRYEVSMEPTACVLRMGSFYAQILPSQSGKGPFGWYPVAFTKNRHDGNCRFTWDSPDGHRLLIRHDATKSALGADATEFLDGGNVCAQLYGKPNMSVEDWGGYEAWNGWELDAKRRVILVEYDREDGLSTSLCLTVEDL